jgi:hypothetical protein
MVRQLRQGWVLFDAGQGGAPQERALADPGHRLWQHYRCDSEAILKRIRADTFDAVGDDELANKVLPAVGKLAGGDAYVLF